MADAVFANSNTNLQSDDLLTKHPIGLADYQHQFNQVMDALHKGDSFLMNLTIPKPFQNKLDFQTYFEHAKS